MGEKKESKKPSITQREFSSGGVVYKKIGNKILWLVARSMPSKDYPMDVWRLPKGWIDDRVGGKLPGAMSSGEVRVTEQDLQNTAAREVNEEGGVEARVVTKIGSEMYVINSKLRERRVLKFVTFYLMEWLEDLEAGFGPETSEIAWLTYGKARKKLTHSGEKKILDKAKKLLDSGVQGSLI